MGVLSWLRSTLALALLCACDPAVFVPIDGGRRPVGISIPERPDVGDSTDLPEQVVVLRDVHFDGAGTLGWDIDHRCSLPPEPPATQWDVECAPPDGVNVVDLQECRDDSFGANIATTFPSLGTQLVADIALALARFRALDLRSDEGRQILVHLNGYRLAAERNGAPELEMAVVIGKASERDQTPMMSTRLEAISVNPSWGVPQRIVDERLRIDAKDLPELLIDQGYDVTVESSGRWRVRMPPGPENPLGKLKFHLADSFGVYLHDTNLRSAFARDERSLSHGCVRLSDPRGLARWLLPERQLDLEEALAYATFMTTFEVGPVPTHLIYQTVLVEEGRLVRYPDLYGKDPAALATIDGSALAAAVRARAR